MRFMRYNTITAVLLAATCTAVATADAVRLKSSVRLPARADAVRLSLVADLEGEEARRFADLVVAEIDDPSQPLEIPIAEVRRRLHEAGAHRGRVNISGRSVIVRPRSTSGATAPDAMQGMSIETAKVRRAAEVSPHVELHATAMIAQPTLGGRIARDVIRALGVEPGDLRLRFERGETDLLDLPEAGRQYEIVPESSLRTDRVRLTVRTWVDGTIAETRTITLRPIVHVPVLVLRRDLAHGDEIGLEDIEVKTQWLSPNQAGGPTRPEEIAGRLATRRLHRGDVLREKNARRRTVVERGDRVVVRCLVGGVVITLQAEARDDGARGDAIEFQKLGERTTFQATVVGPGEAAVKLGR
ncbi:MAG: flagellar basal body P-ring formation protein FlgA [Planctomycetes bacterium]|nr:flagellar basal body P-ring formation protein FlgA [Planctomycetota bacterium]